MKKDIAGLGWLFFVLLFSFAAESADLSRILNGAVTRWNRLFSKEDCKCDLAAQAAALSDDICKKSGYNFGEYNLTHGMEKADPMWTFETLMALPSKVWNQPNILYGSPEYKKEFFKRYGLSFSNDAHEKNNDLPLGLLKTDKDYSQAAGTDYKKLILKNLGISLTKDKQAKDKDDPARSPLINPGVSAGKGKAGITISCSACHESVIFGERGQAPNVFFNTERLFNDLNKVQGVGSRFPFPMNPTLENSMVNAADHVGVLEFIIRNQKDHSENKLYEWAVKAADSLGIAKLFAKNIPYLKTPPWFNFPIKSLNKYGFYYDGLTPQSFNFAQATFSIAFSDKGELTSALAEWQKCAKASLLQLEPPPYPFAKDVEKARRGFNIFSDYCIQCHGTYAWPNKSDRPRLTDYKPQILPAANVGTNEVRAFFAKKFDIKYDDPITNSEDYKRSVREPGYVAPPLAGIWVRAPYTHTGGVANLRQLLFVRPEKRIKNYVLKADPANPEDYDQKDVGWKAQELKPNEKRDPFDRVYDASKSSSLGNDGHPYGLDVAPKDQDDLLEFLKFL